ncbi:uncharacterized protein LOC119725525 [Patiria miniata]|uniref:Uncharacterized protein n=1 Tax=Patiria miniata TaxID=46514 RepID=A0A913ZPA3_PATMI|nr:uncharacterized protein LOC119725525 [Patiria miniata]
MLHPNRPILPQNKESFITSLLQLLEELGTVRNNFSLRNYARHLFTMTMVSTVNKLRLPVLTVVLSVCLVARPANSQTSTAAPGTITTLAAGGDATGPTDAVTPGTGGGGTGTGMTDIVTDAPATPDPALLPNNITTISSSNNTEPAAEGGLTETQKIIVIAVCAGAGGLLLIVVVASLAYVKVRNNKRRRVRVTTTGPQAQATGNTNESDRQVLDA